MADETKQRLKRWERTRTQVRNRILAALTPDIIEILHAMNRQEAAVQLARLLELDDELAAAITEARRELRFRQAVGFEPPMLS